MLKKLFALSLSLLLGISLLTACGPAARQEPDPAPESSAPSESASPPVETPVETSPAPAESTGPELSERDRDWIEDIEFLRKEYKEKHLDPFYYCSEEEFDWKLDRLAAQVGGLSDTDIFYELAAVIAGMRDNHTTLWWDYDPIYDGVFAVNIFVLDGKLYLYNYLEGLDQFKPYLMREIVAVNGVNSQYIMRKAASLCQSEQLVGTEFPEYPTFFDWVGCGYTEGYTFQILNDKGEVESVEVPLITLEEGKAGSWVYPEHHDDLVYMKGGDRTAYYEGPDGGCIQWCIGEMWYPSSLGYSLHEIGGLEEQQPDCHKIAIDLRKCPGGSSDSQPFLDEVWKKAELLEGKDIYILTGNYTASAAIRMISFLKDKFGAVTVGRPTGQFTSFFSRTLDRDRNPSILPNSQIKVKICDLWRDNTEILEDLDITPFFEEYYDENGRLYAWETTVLPDVYVSQDLEDLRQGKDTVLEWVLAQ